MDNNGKGKKELAVLQFDHFYSQTKYPYLSMSLYNLIPSCPSCNQSKSDNALDINFNPYYNGIADSFEFRVSNPLELICGVYHPEHIVISINKKNGRIDVDKLFRQLHIVKQYERHKDIIQEIYDKSYCRDYYARLLPYLNNIHGTLSSKSFDELLLGVSLNSSEIDNRPLTKFIQDIWKQARAEGMPK